MLEWNLMVERMIRRELLMVGQQMKDLLHSVLFKVRMGLAVTNSKMSRFWLNGPTKREL